jgi:hypothetical protein
MECQWRFGIAIRFFDVTLLGSYTCHADERHTIALAAEEAPEGLRHRPPTPVARVFSQA